MRENFNRNTLLLYTFIVAFCSIGYELIFSESLRVIFGGTVARYAITIGLYMFFLGVGSVSTQYIERVEKVSNTIRTEFYLSVAGPLGVVYIFVLNSLPFLGPKWRGQLLILSHLPIIVVGFLSGMEIPLLTWLVEDEEKVSLPGEAALARLGRGIETVIYTLLGLVFHTADKRKNDEFSLVLAVDYLGSLAGTVVYALVLYPDVGLIPSVFVLGLLNTLVAVSIYLQFDTASPLAVLKQTTPSHGPIAIGRRGKAIMMIGLLLTGANAGALASGDSVERTLSDMHFESSVEDEWRSKDVTVEVSSRESTKYQDIVMYKRQFGNSSAWDKCLRLDDHIQMCDSWVKSYHSGLVDMPMTMFENPSDKRVLLIGGGDYVAVDHLRKYNVTVDQVDIDGEFLEYTKNRSYFEKHHNNAYKYDKLNTTVGDAYQYLQQTDKQYDLILLDIPGIKSDKMLPLYSTEFLSLVQQHLTEDGVAVSWVYSKYAYAGHHKAYVNTLRDAGFTHYMPYTVYDDYDGDSALEQGEQFYVLSDGNTPTMQLNRSDNKYINTQQEKYHDAEWDNLPRYRGVEPNSIFDPNYKIIVNW